ncbi:MAG: hypothetical protein ACOC2V_03270 [Alkalispirochaeta sp.]
MQKRVIVLVGVVLLLGATPFTFSQDSLSQLSTDLQTMLDELGKEMGPNLQTVSVLNHGLGSAEIGDFPRMYVSVSAGASVAPGILKFTGDEEKFLNYALLENFLEEAGLEEGSGVRDITDNYAPYPSARAAFGVGLAGGWEVEVQGGVIPQAAADTSGVDGIAANITTIGGRVRKVLVRQERGVPAVSVGVGYVYSGINFGYDLAEIEPLDAGGTTLDLDGEITLRVSTRFLRVFYPFVGACGYFQTTDYKAGIDSFSALVGNATTPTSPTTEPLSEQEFRNFNVVLNTGVDVKLAFFNLFGHLNYAVTTRAPGAIIGMRIQI